MKKLFSNLKYIQPYDILSIFIFIALVIPALIYKLYLRITHQRIWLITEDGHYARDNGYYFFKYMRTEHKDFRAYYVIDKKAHDYQKVEKYGNIVQFRSLKHWIYYMSDEYNISSQKNGNPAQALFYILHVKLNLFNNRVFLQHGIILNKTNYVFYNETKFKYLVCGAKREYDYIKENFGYPDGSLLPTGLARFDNLSKPHKIKNNQILIMPSWRSWLGRETNAFTRTSDFEQTTFYKNWNGLLNDPTFIDFIEKNNLTVKFYPHINMQKFLSDFHPASKNIELVSTETDIQQIMKESAIMITDYSSVSVDFAYMKKPIIYYQFDQKEYREKQYEPSYFNYEKDGFGPVTTTAKETIQAVKALYKNGRFENKKTYLNNSISFFEQEDGSQTNCQKIYDAITGEKSKLRNKLERQNFFQTILLYTSMIACFTGLLSINIYYTITPMMITGAIIFLYRIIYKVRIKKKLFKFELIYALFLLGAIVSAIFSYDRYQSIKILIKLAAIIFSIFQYRALYYEAGKDKVKKIFCRTSFIFIIVTLILYINGLFALNFKFNIPNIKLLGVMIDRKMPRLMTLAAPDPNASCQFLMIPLLLFLCCLHKTKTKHEKIFYVFNIVGYIIAIALTLSRGGIVTLACALITYLIFNGQRIKTKIKILGVIFAAIALLTIASTQILKTDTSENNSSFITTIIERFTKSDGGSGRTRLWEHAIATFQEHPLTGIGVNSSMSYNTDKYKGSVKIIHNTYIELLSETGILTAIVFVIFIIATLIKAFTIRKQDNAFSLTVMVSLIVSCLFLSKQYWEIFYIHILIVDLCATFLTQKDALHIKASILFPTLNTNEQYLKTAIGSILSQTHTNFEFIIISDGGNDDEYITKNFSDNRIKIIKHEKPRGIAKSLNEAIEKSSGKYLIRMDADDISRNTRLEEQIIYMEEHPDITVASTFIRKFGSAKVTSCESFISPNDVYVKSIINDPIAHPSVIMRASTIKESGYFYDPSYERAEDYELWRRVMNDGHKITIMRYLGLYYRVHSSQVSTAKRKEQLAQVERIQEAALKDLRLPKTDVKYLFMLGGHSSITDKRDLKQFIKKAVAKNKKLKVYSQRSFKKILYSSYDAACFRNKLLVFPNRHFVSMCIHKIYYKILCTPATIHKKGYN